MDPMSILGVLSALGGLFGQSSPAQQLKPSAPTPEIPQGILGALGQQQKQPRQSLGVNTTLPGVESPSISYPSLGADPSKGNVRNAVEKGLNKKVAPNVPGVSPEGNSGVRAAAPSGKDQFLGLSGDQWSSIGTATGILAKLFEKQPGPPVLRPGGDAGSSISHAPVGQGLVGAQRSLNIVSGSAPSFPTQDMAKLMRRT